MRFGLLNQQPFSYDVAAGSINFNSTQAPLACFTIFMALVTDKDDARCFLQFEVIITSKSCCPKLV